MLMRYILFIISSFQDQRPQQEKELHQHLKDNLVSLRLMKMMCWASVTYFQFYLLQFACRLAEEILSYTSVEMRVVISGYDTSYNLYFGRSKIYKCGFNNQMH